MIIPASSNPAKNSPTLHILDSSSEFIFGESVNSLLPDSLENIKFLERINNAKSGVGVRFFLGRLRFLHRDGRFRDACRYVNAWTQQRVDRAFERAQRQEAAAKQQQGGTEPESAEKKYRGPRRSAVGAAECVLCSA